MSMVSAGWCDTVTPGLLVLWLGFSLDRFCEFAYSISRDGEFPDEGAAACSVVTALWFGWGTNCPSGESLCSYHVFENLPAFEYSSLSPEYGDGSAREGPNFIFSNSAWSISSIDFPLLLAMFCQFFQIPLSGTITSNMRVDAV